VKSIKSSKYLSKKGMDVNGIISFGLLWCCLSIDGMERAKISGNGVREGIEHLLSKNVDYCAPEVTPLLFECCRHDVYTDLLDKLIGKKIDLTVRNSVGSTPLHIATLAGALQNVKLLLEGDAPVNAQNNEGVTPLFISVSNYRLVKTGYKIKEMATSLYRMTNHFKIMRLLLEYGADPNYARPEDLRTPLMICVDNYYEIPVRAKREKMVRLLLTYGANPDCVDKNQKNAIIIAKESSFFTLAHTIETSKDITYTRQMLECAICKSKLAWVKELGATIRMLACNHSEFHTVCLKEMKKNAIKNKKKPSCPLCRAPIEKK
jgi:hypothetical protein